MDVAKSIQQLKLKFSIGGTISCFFTPITLSILSLASIIVANSPNLYRSISHSSTKMNPVVNILFVMIGLFAIFMFYRTNALLKLTPVHSKISLTEKSDIIDSLANSFKLVLIKKGTNRFELSLIRGILAFSPDLDITILIDEKGFYINVTDMGKGFVASFGSYTLWTEKIKEYIQSEITEIKNKGLFIE